MAHRLQQELRQGRPFASVEMEAMLSLARTAGQARRLVQALLKPWRLTETQFNILRILRGAGDEGLTCGEIGERLVTHAPDITRLLERLARRGLVERQRASIDKRLVGSRITEEGLRLLEEVGPELDAAPSAMLRSMPEENVRLLVDLLEEVRFSLGQFEDGIVEDDPSLPAG